jgi:hypothetical protein
MPNLSQRSTATELMDEENISFAEFHHCLTELERINHLTLAYRPTLQWLRPWLKTNEPLYILDAASGGGDMLRKISRKWPARFSGKNSCRLVGVDLNPWSKKSAEFCADEFSNTSSTNAVGEIPSGVTRSGVTRSGVTRSGVTRSGVTRSGATRSGATRSGATRSGVTIQLKSQPSAITYVTENIFEFEPDQPVDIIISSLFTHHLTNAQIVEFLRWMNSRARKGWFINDLHRHIIPYYFIKFSTALFSCNRLVRNDAAVSVARAFTRADWQRLINEAGLDSKVRVQWFFPFRLCISCNKLQDGEKFPGDDSYPTDFSNNTFRNNISRNNAPDKEFSNPQISNRKKFSDQMSGSPTSENIASTVR